MAASTLSFCRTDPRASPAALVAAWLIDAIAGGAKVELARSETEFITLDVGAGGAHGPVRQLAGSALAEARFAGWELATDG